MLSVVNKVNLLCAAVIRGLIIKLFGGEHILKPDCLG